MEGWVILKLQCRIVTIIITEVSKAEIVPWHRRTPVAYHRRPNKIVGIHGAHSESEAGFSASTSSFTFEFPEAESGLRTAGTFNRPEMIYGIKELCETSTTGYVSARFLS
jgi:hypothetical protein